MLKKPLCRCGLVLTSPNISSYAPCSPFGCHLCLRCCPRPLGFAQTLASFHAGDTQQLAAPLLPPCSSFCLALGIPWLSPELHPCRILCILVPCSRLVAVLHADSSWRLTFLSPPGSSPISLQPNTHPKSFSSQQFLWPCLSVRSACFSTFLCVHCSCCLGQDGECEGGRSCLIPGRDWTCGLDSSGPQLCLSGNPAQPRAGVHPERGKV